MQQICDYRFTSEGVVNERPVLSGLAKILGNSDDSCLAIMLASQAVGPSRIYGSSTSEEVLDFISVLKFLGVRVASEGEHLVVNGVGICGFFCPEDALCLSKSPFIAAITLGVLSTHPFSTFLFSKHKSDYDLDDLKQIMEILLLSGSKFVHDNIIPMLVIGCEDGIPIEVDTAISSNAVKAAVLMSCINIPGRSRILAKKALSSYPELLLKHLGTDIIIESKCDSTEVISIQGRRELLSGDIAVFPSASHVLHVVAAALLLEGSSISVPNALYDNVMRQILDIFARMGGDISIFHEGESCNIRVRSSVMHGTEIDSRELNLITEEIPIVCVVSALSAGTTTIFGISELEECNRERLNLVVDGLMRCGVNAMVDGDSLVIHGCSGIDKGATIEVADEYSRAAIAFLVLGMCSCGGIFIKGRRVHEELIGFVATLNELCVEGKILANLLKQA